MPAPPNWLLFPDIEQFEIAGEPLTIMPIPYVSIIDETKAHKALL